MALLNLPYQNILNFKRVPLRVIAITALTSIALQAGAVIQEYPLYVVVFVGLVPWVPAFTLETLWKYQHYHWLAIFGTICVLQVGHLCEHAVQQAQLIITDGQLAKSRGVFGQLDFETVHFWWDTGVWIGALVLFWRFGLRNPWLWVSLFFATAHEVEHMYLYYINLFQFDFYKPGPDGGGGLAGVLGEGGIIPTVARPYLHFGYNFMVVIPLLLAFLQQLGHVYDEYLVRALPHVPAEQLVRATGKLEQRQFKQGSVIMTEGDVADNLMIITKGVVEVYRSEGPTDVPLSRLTEGQYFGEIGLLLGGRRTASVRAVTDVEVLALDKEAFQFVVLNSEETAHELDMVARLRLRQARALGPVPAAAQPSPGS